MPTKQLLDVNKHVEDVIADKISLDPWVQNRMVERLIPLKEIKDVK